jgi:hypothetical protein
MSPTIQAFARQLVALPVNLVRYLLLAIAVLATLLWWIIQFLLGRPTRGDNPPKRCPDEIPPHVRRKPDPCLYSQAYLTAQGMPVTWDNPDITLTETDGTPVDSGSLLPDHDYIVHGRIWNASFNPAIGVDVRAAFRNWGLGGPWLVMQTDPGGSEHVEVLVVAPWANAISRFRWKTPPDPGHYCLRVACHHPDDKNPDNNVGQENTQVIDGQPGQKLAVPVPAVNDSQRATRVRLFADTYQIPTREWDFTLETTTRRYGDPPRRGATSINQHLRTLVQRLTAGPKGPTNVAYAYRSRAPVVAAQQAVPRAIPAAWTLTIDGQPLDQPVALAPGESRDLLLEIDIPATARPGEHHALNLDAISSDSGRLAGVTVIVRVV